MIAAPPYVHPWPIGVGPRYQPPARVRAGRPVGRLRCGRSGTTFAVHLELFANRRVVIVPAGIGVAHDGCRYPLTTSDPTGVVRVARRGRHTLGDLFAVWGRQLSPRALLSFRGRVRVFVDGRERRADPRRIVLRRHDEIVVEIRGYVAPHPFYLFPRGE
ncbi:MAG TPA: hypothetical protein VFA05_11295 [Gaiellaceae bacterium]|nr:hypothetical protein [Gaiellaceae bacterium]